MSFIWSSQQSGWLEGVAWVDSPNFNERPRTQDVSLIVIHNISLPAGHFSGNDVQDLFSNELEISKHPSYQSLKGLKVSAHFFIRRQGHIIQFVSTHDRAWHAGASSWQGRSDCNDFSVGIELEGTDHEPYEQAQYLALTQLTQAIQQRFPIEAIVGHIDIAPDRKTDPGPAFDWSYYRRRLLAADPANESLCFSHSET